MNKHTTKVFRLSAGHVAVLGISTELNSASPVLAVEEKCTLHTVTMALITMVPMQPTVY